MSKNTLQPKGEDLRQAIRWISDQGGWSHQRLEEAGLRFNLSPIDQEFLLHFFLKQQGGKAS